MISSNLVWDVPPPPKPRVEQVFPTQTSIFGASPAIATPARTPEPVAETLPEPEPVEMADIDLGAVGIRIDDEEPPMAVPVATGPVVSRPEPVSIVVPIVSPPPVEEERPLSLFERMMQMSRGGKPRPAPEPTLAPEPAAADVEIPPFFKRQVNN